MVKKMSGAKRVLACACSVAMLGAFAPVAAFADDAAADGAATPYLTVNTVKLDAQGNEVGTDVETKAYTKEQVEAMAKTVDYDYTYGSMKGDAFSGYKLKVTKMVSFADLFKGMPEWNSTSSLRYAELDNTKAAKPSYKEVTQASYYYPNYVGAATTFDTAGAVKVENGLALSAQREKLNAGDLASDITVATPFDSSCPMTVFGATDGAIHGGNYYWTGINDLTIRYTKLNNSMTAKLAKSTVKKGKTTTVKTSKAKGKVTYKSSSKKVTVSKKGKITVNKKAKAGKYTITVKAAGNADYLAKTAKLTLKVK